MGVARRPMTNWTDDIDAHRLLVKTYMGDFIDEAIAENERPLTNDLSGGINLYSLMRHAIYCSGHTPSWTDNHIGSTLVGAIGYIHEWEWQEIPRILTARAEVHDLSKYHDPEADTFRIYTPKLKELTYGSDEYKAALAAMGPGLAHHYAVNSHHPEHYKDGVRDMSFVDIVEMFCDWCAACDMKRVALDIGFQAKRFGITSEMQAVLEQTLIELRNWNAEHNVPSYI